jgi:hypothetical protein
LGPNASSNSSVQIRKTTNLSKIRKLANDKHLRYNYAQDNFLFNIYDKSFTTNTNSNNTNARRIYEETRYISYVIPRKNQLISPNSLMKYKSQVSISNQEVGRIQVNCKKNFINADVHTKDKTKNTNCIVSPNAVTLRQQSTNSSLAVEKGTEKQPTTNNLNSVYNTLCVDVSYLSFVLNVTVLLYNS